MKTKNIDFEISFLEGVIRRRPDYIDALIPLAEAYTRKGFHEKGLEIDKRLVLLCKDDPIVYYNLACSQTLSGQTKEALLSLKVAIRLGYRDFEHLKKDPDLKGLHSEPQFQKWVADYS